MECHMSFGQAFHVFVRYSFDKPESLRPLVIGPKAVIECSSPFPCLLRLPKEQCGHGFNCDSRKNANYEIGARRLIRQRNHCQNVNETNHCGGKTEVKLVPSL